MKMFPQSFIFILSLLILILPASAETFYQAHTTIDLISDVKSIRSQKPFWIGVRMRMDKNWHVYWKNPGDSGLAASLNWDLPKGFRAGPVQWPFPERISIGPLTSFGYEDEVILWSEITPAALTASEIPISVQVKWLACKVDCIPGRAEFFRSFPVGKSVEIDPAGSKALSATRERWPIMSAPWSVKAYSDFKDFMIELKPSGSPRTLHGLTFFPDDDKLIDHASPQAFKQLNEKYTLTVRKSTLLQKDPARIKGVLVEPEGWDEEKHRALLIDIPVENNEGAVPVAEEGSGGSILWMCLFAFIGGIILNLMPCVLPVLSLKILGLVHSVRDKRKVFLSGVAFSSGVLISFWIVAGGLIILRSAGHELGWGFQFQSSLFVASMCVLLFTIALNFFGFFEILVAVPGVKNIPTHGILESFLSGMLATVLATPCTAPFMGTAIGFALAQPIVTALLIFTFLGLGMAAPYFFLCLFPGLLGFIPKPGKWMNVLKNILGVVLLACVIWLAWVLGVQKGINAVLILLTGLWLIGFGLWLLGLDQKKHRQPLLILAGILFISGILIAIKGVDILPVNNTSINIEKSGGIPWQEFSERRLDGLRAQGHPVFIDFTAVWCLTCQVNDRVVLQNKRVIETFEELGIIALKADWTNHNEEITRALEKYGKNSIPLYVLYVPGEDRPVVLPEILTEEFLVDTLRNIHKKN